jgi:hypothetical protein
MNKQKLHFYLHGTAPLPLENIFFSACILHCEMCFLLFSFTSRRQKMEGKITTVWSYKYQLFFYVTRTNDRLCFIFVHDYPLSDICSTLFYFCSWLNAERYSPYSCAIAEDGESVGENRRYFFKASTKTINSTRQINLKVILPVVPFHLIRHVFTLKSYPIMASKARFFHHWKVQHGIYPPIRLRFGNLCRTASGGSWKWTIIVLARMPRTTLSD